MNNQLVQKVVLKKKKKKSGSKCCVKRALLLRDIPASAWVYAAYASVLRPAVFPLFLPICFVLVQPLLQEQDEQGSAVVSGGSTFFYFFLN